MPVKGGKLTPRERAIAKHYAASGDKTLAAKKAGYAVPHVAGHEVLARPAVAAEAQRISLARLQNEVLPLAIERHLKLLTDKQTAGPALTKAIELAYKYGLSGDAAGANKQPHEMTGEELAQAIDALKRAAADRAKPIIDAAPVEIEQASVFE